MKKKTENNSEKIENESKRKEVCVSMKKEMRIEIKISSDCAQIKESNINKVTLQNIECSELTKISSKRKSGWKETEIERDRDATIE